MPNGLQRFRGMEILELEKFKQLEKACGNRYLAIKLVSFQARRLGDANRNAAISEANLIQWVLTGKCPYSKSKLETRRFFKETLDDVEEKLCYVDDEEVREEVRRCYKQSIRNKHLTLSENPSINKYKISRANILLRMIWYHFKEEED